MISSNIVTVLNTINPKLSPGFHSNVRRQVSIHVYIFVVCLYLCLSQSECSIFLSLVSFCQWYLWYLSVIGLPSFSQVHLRSISSQCTSAVCSTPLQCTSAVYLRRSLTFLTNNIPITVLRPLLLASLQCTLYCNRWEVTVFSSSHGCFIGSIATDRNNNPGTTRVVRRLFQRAVSYTLLTQQGNQLFDFRIRLTVA